MFIKLAKGSIISPFVISALNKTVKLYVIAHFVLLAIDSINMYIISVNILTGCCSLDYTIHSAILETLQNESCKNAIAGSGLIYRN